MDTKEMSMLTEANRKYHRKIFELYGSYLPDFSRIPDLTKNVYLMDDFIYQIFFRRNTRAVCKEGNGYIYIKKSAFSEYVLVHEYIHRLSRNVSSSFLGIRQYRTGIADLYKGIHYVGFNEILTEWIAQSITGKEPEIDQSKNIYQTYFRKYHPVLDDCDQKSALLTAYFNGRGNEISEILKDIMKMTYDELKTEMNDLSEQIIRRIPYEEKKE